MYMRVSLNRFLCTGAHRYKSTTQYKGGLKLSCPLLKKYCS